ncbi:uncharacterized protein BX663DRAFT_444133 [Cokeromyces recurvatus]|uniref:uncharacterized protein n=1 Tax=Cokeromyces recurvatus TaxID=90255 RepID=UPI002220BFA2|nr:uncharacterized protein BX663DRAFT_444133 [Cokeromyces recurvatus]KAI7897869.1 hypothetical protein BX663DRAFT_444133 [Cokeromyces recurvatus]
MDRLKALWKYIRPLAIMLFINIALPLALYYILKIWLSVLVALILSGIPPFLHVIYRFWKSKQFDIIGCICVISYITSAVLSLITKNVRLNLLRDSFTNALISLLFFVTLIPIHTRWCKVRPLIFLITQQMLSERPDVEWTDSQDEKHTMNRSEWLWEYVPAFRKFCYVLTAAWSAALMLEFIIKIIFIEATHLTIDQIILYGNIIIAVITVSMTIITILGRRFIYKRIISTAKEWHKQNNYSNRL